MRPAICAIIFSASFRFTMHRLDNTRDLFVSRFLGRDREISNRNIQQKEEYLCRDKKEVKTKRSRSTRFFPSHIIASKRREIDPLANEANRLTESIADLKKS